MTAIKEKLSNKKYLILLNIFFMLISFLLVNVFDTGKNYYIMNQPDYMRHLGAMYELVKAIQNHNNWFNLYSFSSFHSVGSAVQNFYPNICVFPYVILALLTHNWVLSMKLGTAFYIYASICINYVFFKTISKNNVISSYMFAVVYTFAMSVYTWILIYADFGTFIAAIFLPAIVITWYQLLIKQKKKYRYVLAILIAMTTYSHFLINYIAIIMLLVATAIYFVFHHNNWKQDLINLAISSGIYILLTGYFWIYIFKYLSVIVPTSMQYNMTGSSTYNFIKFWTYYPPLVNYMWIFIVILFPFIYKKASKFQKYSYWLLIFSMFLSSDSFPWKWFQGIKLISVLQIPTLRFFPFINIFGAVTGTFLIEKFISALHSSTQTKSYSSLNKKTTDSKHVLDYLIVGAVIIGISFWIQFFILSNMKIDIPKRTPNRFNPFDYTHKAFNDAAASPYPYDDYFPKATEKHISPKKYHNMTINSGMIQGIIRHKIISKDPATMSYPYQKYNKAHFTVRNTGTKQSLNLPILNYKNQYNILVNGKKTSYGTSNRGTVQITLPAGKSKLTLITKPIISQLIMAGVAIGSWIVIIYNFIKFKIKKKTSYLD